MVITRSAQRQLSAVAAAAVAANYIPINYNDGIYFPIDVWNIIKEYAEITPIINIPWKEIDISYNRKAVSIVCNKNIIYKRHLPIKEKWRTIKMVLYKTINTHYYGCKNEFLSELSSVLSRATFEHYIYRVNRRVLYEISSTEKEFCNIIHCTPKQIFLEVSKKTQITREKMTEIALRNVQSPTHLIIQFLDMIQEKYGDNGKWPHIIGRSTEFDFNNKIISVNVHHKSKINIDTTPIVQSMYMVGVKEQWWKITKK